MFSGSQRGKAEEAINYYMSVFKNSAVERIERYTDSEEGPTGAVKYAAFSLNGQNFKAMDSGVDVPFTFSPAISFVVNCESQQEIDYYWERLTLGGDERAQQCGWLADRYGVSWQVVPETLGIMMTDANSEKTQRVMKALIPMKKLILSELKNAFEGTEETGANYEGPEYAYRKIDTLTPNEEL
jgi:predicted 3-demethylubiquinone-9 3-methyltransferase (glyoxalase superfamily)